MSVKIRYQAEGGRQDDLRKVAMFNAIGDEIRELREGTDLEGFVP